MGIVKGSDVMLIQFKFKNHKGFYDENILDMSATSEKRHMDDVFLVNGNKILPLVAIYGANASGKTSIIEAFNRMSFLIMKSHDIDVSKPLWITPFAFNGHFKKEPSEFEVSLAINDFEYRYGFSATKDEILEEWLYQKPFKAGSKVKEKVIFERCKTDVEFSKEYSNLSLIETIVNNKSLILSILGRRGEEIVDGVYKWFSKNFLISEDISVVRTSIFSILYKNKKFADKFYKILNEIDPCLKKLKIEPYEDENQTIKYLVSGVHNDVDGSDKEYYMPIRGESGGTNKIVELLPIILMTLEQGGILFIDELDTKLHPLIYKRLLDLFLDKKMNKKHAQIIYTTHNTFMFNSESMRRDQIYLVAKDRSGESKVYSLSDFKKLRMDADYEKKYFAGEFGAIPFIEEV